MARTLLISLGLLLMLPATVMAQSPGSTLDSGRSAGVRGDNITSTGQTVPNPGASQSAGVTPLDKGIQREDTRIQNGICKGC